jgi:glycosyltransferase involved in cell wall biosynthesis
VGTRGNGAVRTSQKTLTDWYHAPPPGTRSGVADYAATLRCALAEFGIPRVDLYHLGNNALHAAIYRAALVKPGVIVLHDTVLHHFLLGQLSREAYVDEFVYNYGEWRRDIAEELWAGRGSSGVDPRYFQFPMLKRITERARAIITHNEGAAAMARAHAPAGTAIHVIPHFFKPVPVPDHAETARFRESLGISQGATLFGIFGYLRETKRVVPSIQAFRRLNAVRPETALLLAGDAVSADLRRLLDFEADHPAIYRLPHMSESHLQTASAAVDCCINLRYPAAGETSGIAMRLMGIGKPVILTSGPENAGIPIGACLPVSHGVAETAELFDHMGMVAEFPQIAREIGLQARQHILTRHSLETVAREYWQVMCAVSS